MNQFVLDVAERVMEKLAMVEIDSLQKLIPKGFVMQTGLKNTMPKFDNNGIEALTTTDKIIKKNNNLIANAASDAFKKIEKPIQFDSSSGEGSSKATGSFEAASVRK